METSILLKSKDRELFGEIINQETKNGFLSISKLQKAYENARWQYGWSDRKISDIMQTDTFKERVYYLLLDQNIIKTDFMGFMNMVNNDGIAKVLKGLGVYKTTGARDNKMTLASPYIWILLAMELNPMIYAKVVVWLTDTLIFDRVEAGDEFRPMNESIKKIIQNPDYPKYSIAINKKVFGVHKTGMRNLASAQELKKITRIEQFIKQGIDIGMIKNDEQIMYTIQNIDI
jgi:hypothetical protein